MADQFKENSRYTYCSAISGGFKFEDGDGKNIRLSNETECVIKAPKADGAAEEVPLCAGIAEPHEGQVVTCTTVADNFITFRAETPLWKVTDRPRREYANARIEEIRTVLEELGAAYTDFLSAAFISDLCGHDLLDDGLADNIISRANLYLSTGAGPLTEQGRSDMRRLFGILAGTDAAEMLCTITGAWRFMACRPENTGRKIDIIWKSSGMNLNAFLEKHGITPTGTLPGSFTYEPGWDTAIPKLSPTQRDCQILRAAGYSTADICSICALIDEDCIRASIKEAGDPERQVSLTGMLMVMGRTEIMLSAARCLKSPSVKIAMGGFSNITFINTGLQKGEGGADD